MSGNADWSNPTLSSLYTAVLDILKDRDIDAATLFVGGSATNLPTGAIRYNRSTHYFQEWDGAAWNNLSYGGLGTMSTQNSNAVAITGGTITGATLNGSDISSGTVALARGGTGASLSLGALGRVMQSDGSNVVFGTDGSALTGLNATNLASGTVPSARLGSGGAGAGAKVLSDAQTFITPPQDITRLTANTGTTTDAGINYLDSYTVSGLTAKDRLVVYASAGAGGTNMNDFGVYNSTAGVAFADSIGNNNIHMVKVTIWYQDGIGVISLAEMYNASTGVIQSYTAVSFTWTGSWGLSLRSGGVSGSHKWSWLVELHKGQ